MSSRKINIISSSSEDDENRYATITDEKKRKRMISNRESARRSRMKKEQHIKDLNDQVAYFTTKSNEMLQKINEIGPRYMAVESENKILRMQGEELKKRLELLEEMLVSGQLSCSFVFDDVVNMQDPLIKPWMQQLPFQTQTVNGIYQF